MSHKDIIIRERWWWGAGTPKVYDWVKDGHHQWGVGLRWSDIMTYDELFIKIDGKNYHTETKSLKPFILRYRSCKPIKGEMICAVAKDLLQEIIIIEIDEKQLSTSSS